MLCPADRQVDIRFKPGTGTLYCDVIASPAVIQNHWTQRGDVLIDTGFAVQVGTGRETSDLSRSMRRWCGLEQQGLLSISAKGADGIRYTLLMSVCEHPLSLPGGLAFVGEERAILQTGEAVLLTESE